MSKLKNEIGNTYSYLTVIERAPNKSDGRARWICQCKCGKKTIVTGVDLRNGNVKSCGCYQRERTREASLIDLTGKTIGNFTVLEYNKEKAKWKCRCNLCGNNEVYISTSNLQVQESCGCLTSSKGERRIRDLLIKNSIPFVQEKRFSDLIFKDSKKPARFDFYVNNRYIIEFDGRQHILQGDGIYDNSVKFQKTQEHDHIKNEYCKNHNIPLIRIPYYELNNISLEMLIPETSKYII